MPVPSLPLTDEERAARLTTGPDATERRRTVAAADLAEQAAEALPDGVPFRRLRALLEGSLGPLLSSGRPAAPAVGERLKGEPSDGSRDDEKTLISRLPLAF